jgi:hypothetical protein
MGVKLNTIAKQGAPTRMIHHGPRRNRIETTNEIVARGELSDIE